MIKAIVACDIGFGIGKNGTLPWPFNREDLKQFKKKTSGHIVVMGRKTWDDPKFPKPLPNRENYVVTSKRKFFPKAVTISTNVLESIKSLDENSDKDVWIIGGNNIFTQCLNIIDEFHFTLINKHYDCDVILDFEITDFELSDAVHDENNYNSYLVYRRK